MIKSCLANRLRHLRKKQGLTQEEVARHLHIERQTYCNYENETRTPPLDMIVLLANFYGVSVDYLVRENSRENVLSDAEAALLASFRSLSDRNQEEILLFIRFKSAYSSLK